jgi:hypothetical protein
MRTTSGRVIGISVGVWEGDTEGERVDGRRDCSGSERLNNGGDDAGLGGSRIKLNCGTDCDDKDSERGYVLCCKVDDEYANDDE